MSAADKLEWKPEPSAPATKAEAFALADVMEGPLQDRLDFYSASLRNLSPDVNSAYEALIERLQPLKAAGPKLGARCPDFLLPDHEGHLTALGSMLKGGPVVLSLNRGHWCPWCRLQLRAMREIHEDIQSFEVRLVSIVPETAAYSRKLVEDNNLPFKVLTDLDLGYALSLGLVVSMGEKLRALYSRIGLDLGLFQSNDGWLLPIPATFAIAKDRRIVARFVDPDFRNRMEPRAILEALRTYA